MRTNATWWIWTPRIAGIAMALFLMLFALDAFDGKPLVSAVPAFLIHLLPAGLVLGVVALGWRFPSLGGLGFFGLALTYAIMVKWRPDWIAVIAGPLLVVAALFVASGRYGDGEHPG
jgi:hypothetical protein